MWNPTSTTRIRILLAIVALQFILLAAAIGLSPAPHVVENFGGATVEISADRSWTILPDQCARVRWDLEGIESVYVNGEGKVGHDEMSFCPYPNTTTLSFSVTAGDGSTQTFRLPIHDLSSYAIAWLPMLGLLLPLIAAGCYLASMRLNWRPASFGTFLLGTVALLLAGLLLQTAQPVLISIALDQLVAVTQSRDWHLLGCLLAAAIYVPLAMQMFRRGRLRDMRADLVAIGAFLAAVAFLYSQAGFDSIGQHESWPLQALLEGRHSLAKAELVSRFWVLAPHVLASTISWHSFIGYHIVNLLMFWGTMALFYGILRQLGFIPWLALLITMLFLVYPVNSSLMSMRSLPHTFNKLSLLTAVFLVLDCRSFVSRLHLLGIWLALLFNVGSYEIAFVLILLAPLLWFRRDQVSFWRNLNATLIWLLVPIAKLAHMLLLITNNKPYYHGWHFVNSPLESASALETIEHYLNVIVTAYLRTFFHGWQEALDSIALNDWLAPSIITLALVGIVSAYLARSTRLEEFPSRRSVILACLGGIALVLPSIGVVMWLPRLAYQLWRMYVYAPIGAAVAVLAFITLLSFAFNNIRVRQGFVICLGLLLIFPGLSRLYVQQGRFVESANAKARILMQIVEQAPYFESNARLLMMTYMSSSDLRAKRINELDTNMFDSAIYMMYQEGRPQVSFFCIVGEDCSTADTYIRRDFFETSDDFSNVVIFLLHQDLRAELLSELPPQLRDRGVENYDPTALIDTSAPLPPRALSMLAAARRA